MPTVAPAMSSSIGFESHSGMDNLYVLVLSCFLVFPPVRPTVSNMADIDQTRYGTLRWRLSGEIFKSYAGCLDVRSHLLRHKSLYTVLMFLYFDHF